MTVEPNPVSRPSVAPRPPGATPAEARTGSRRRSRRPAPDATAPRDTVQDRQPQPSRAERHRPERAPQARTRAEQPAALRADDRPAARSSRAKTVSVTGVLRVHPRGFAFVERPDADSVFVPGSRLSGLLDGDTVTVRVAEGTDAAREVRLVERLRSDVVGDITADGRFKVDPGVGDLTVAVCGGHRAAAGTTVVARLGADGATVVEVLGDPLSDDALARRMFARHRLPHDHADAVTAEASQLAGRRRGGQAWRRDLRDQTVVTIDADHSEDLDDALSAAAGPDGSIRVWVHIADVAATVRPGSVIDTAAAATPTSVYLPTFTRHMLPPALAAQQLSLLPGVDRDVVTVEMRIDPVGVVRSVDVYEAQIRSDRRLSYVTVGKFLDGEAPDAIGVDDAHAQLLRQLWAAAVRLGQQRVARGGVDAWRTDPDPTVTPSEDDAHLLVERLMVAANEAVAAWLEERGMPVLARCHAAPDNDEIAELEAAATSIGLFGALPRPLTPAAFAALAAQAGKTRRARVFWDAAMSVLNRAVYTTEPGGHFGLGATRYAHFTSPLRRYADLCVHRVVKAYLSGSRDVDVDAMASAAVVINDVTRRADHAERDARRAAALRDLHARQKVSVTVIGKPKGGNVRVVLDAFDVVGSLADAGNLSIGTHLQARIRSVDPITGRLELRRDTTARTPRPSRP